MVLIHQNRQVALPQLNMAPMIDCVFLLLIFFMCTSSFRGSEKVLLAGQHRIGAGQGSLQEDFDPIRIRVQKAEGGALVTCDGRAFASFDELTRLLAARRAIADLPVIIEGQVGVPFRYLAAALDSCARADLRRVAFSSQEVGP